MVINTLFFKYFLIYLIIILAQIAPCSYPQLLSKKRDKNYEHCCAFPCQHGGVCIQIKYSYTCDCQNTGYYGKNCAVETWTTFLRGSFNSLLEVVVSLHYALCSFFSGYLLYFPSYHKMVTDSFSQIHTVGIYDLKGEPYVTLNPLYNNYGAVRLMTPVPEYCPTPLGTKGKKTLYSVSEIYTHLLKRKIFQPSKYINLLFTIYGLHFLLQYIDHGNLHGVTCSHIYVEHGRAFSKGKLLAEIYKGEEYPICQRNIHKKTFSNYLLKLIDKDDNIICVMMVLKNKYQGKSEQADWKLSLIKQNSLTYAMATLWVREHNRVCDILTKLWPLWDDDRLFETARNIVTGEILVITLSEWYPVLMGYKKNIYFDPSYSHLGYELINNRLPIEAFLALHWPNMIPDKFVVCNNTIHLTELFWQNLDTNVVKKFGLYNIIKAFAQNPSGQATIQNTARSLSVNTKYVVEMGRKLRIPSFNRMRVLLGLKPYNSFSKVVKNEKSDGKLKSIYENVEGIEFVTGILVESNRNQRNALGETATTLIGPWLFKALLTHPLAIKSMWKPSTMGGKVGWDIVNTAKFKKLVCQNVNSPEICYKDSLINFRLKQVKRKKVTIKRVERKKKPRVIKKSSR